MDSSEPPSSSEKKEVKELGGRFSNLAKAVKRVVSLEDKRAYLYVAFGLLFACFLAAFEYESRKKPRLNGDGWEYWYQAESFHQHASPELRDLDLETVDDDATGFEIATPYKNPQAFAYARAPDGRLYGVHFWSYGLSAALFEEYQVLMGRTRLANLIIANVFWYFLALTFTLFLTKAPLRERLAMVSFAAIGPIFWYIEWTGGEVFSWSLTLISVVAYRDRRYAVSGFCAGLASMQNPTIIFLGSIAVLQAARERKFRASVLAAIGTAMGLIPYGFFLYHFGKPNLIAAEFATIDNISWLRTWSLIGDFNQGLLPYLPAVVLALLFGSIRMLVLGNIRGLLLASAGIAMAIGTQVSANWNSGCEGLQRYLVWMLPVVAGVAIEGIGGTTRMWFFAVLAGISNLAIFQTFNETEGTRNYLSHTMPAEWILIHLPRAYLAEPEVFIERQRHADNWPLTPSDYPIAFVRPDGSVSKMILDPASVEKVAERFEVDPQVLVSLRKRAAHERGLFYSNHDGDEVRVRVRP